VELVIESNARKRHKASDPRPRSEPLTHDQVDKMLGVPQKRPKSGWIIKTCFTSGNVAYWGQNQTSGHGLTPYWANAQKYESENAALYVAYEYKAAGRFGEFEIIYVPLPNPPESYGIGTGGRA
jgi:hypothetical protein